MRRVRAVHLYRRRRPGRDRRLWRPVRCRQRRRPCAARCWWPPPMGWAPRSSWRRSWGATAASGWISSTTASTTSWCRAPARCSSWIILPPAGCRPEIVAEIVAGVADACREAGCVLLGGETAEMPGVYAPGEFDLAGTIVGVVEYEHILPPAISRPAICWSACAPAGRTPTATR